MARRKRKQDKCCVSGVMTFLTQLIYAAVIFSGGEQTTRFIKFYNVELFAKCRRIRRKFSAAIN